MKPAFRSLAELSRRLGSTFHGVRLDEPATEQFTATLSELNWEMFMHIRRVSCFDVCQERGMDPTELISFLLELSFLQLGAVMSKELPLEILQSWD
ncbi:unnamed protein product [Urochloa humidicola]